MREQRFEGGGLASDMPTVLVRWMVHCRDWADSL